MKWQDVQEAQSSVASLAAAYQEAVNQAHTDAQAALTEFRQRLGYDLDLALGTIQVLRAISRSTSDSSQRSSERAQHSSERAQHSSERARAWAENAQHTSDSSQRPEYTSPVWAYRAELEPLAQAYGFTIVESDVTKNIGSAVPAWTSQLTPVPSPQGS